MPEGREDDARAFYEGVLGLPEVPKPEGLRASGGCWFRAKGADLHLGVEPDFAASKKAHVAFVVADLDVARMRLAEAGREIVEDARLAGVDRIYTYDPFGNRIELVQHA